MTADPALNKGRESIPPSSPLVGCEAVLGDERSTKEGRVSPLQDRSTRNLWRLLQAAQQRKGEYPPFKCPSARGATARRLQFQVRSTKEGRVSPLQEVAVQADSADGGSSPLNKGRESIPPSSQGNHP